MLRMHSVGSIDRLAGRGGSSLMGGLRGVIFGRSSRQNVWDEEEEDGLYDEDADTSAVGSGS